MCNSIVFRNRDRANKLLEDKKCEIIGQIPTLHYASVCIENGLHLIRAESVKRDSILYGESSLSL